DTMLVAEGFYRRRQETVDNQTLELLAIGKIESELNKLLKHYGLLEAGEATPEYMVVHRALRRAESILESQKFGRVSERALAPEVFSPGHIDPPIPELARVAGAIAFIANKPDPGGVFRRVPLLARTGGYVYKQYALALACELLGVEDSQMVYEQSGYLVLSRASRRGQEPHTIRIPVDRQGQMLINFRKGHKERWWDSGFVHLSAGKILEIPQLRQKIKNNLVKQKEAVRKAIELREGDQKRKEYDQLNGEIAKISSRLKSMEAGQKSEQLKLELVALEELAEEMRAEAIDNIRFIYNSLPKEAPSDPGELQEYRNILLFYQDLVETDYQAENQRLERILAESIAALTAKIEGKVCLVGSTASGGAGGSLDYASCPVFAGEVPGIVVHANILNTILQHSFMRQVSLWQQLLLIACCGVLATVLSSLLKPLYSIVPVIVGTGGYVGVNFWAFATGLVLPFVLPLAAILLGWSGVMAYRQLFEAKEKRRMATALGQFTSPAVARRILAQPGMLRLSGETREVSCYFSDLRGFTPLSEQLGAEKTVRLLNRYLDKMTEVLFEHEATVNKFAADGIFAFFGAPEVQADHARRACLAAVDSQIALAKLSEELVREGGSELRMRVGINTGQVVVGNCGSSRKFDYTVLGDTVNLASRLEPSNKFFGSLILVSQRTFEQAKLPEEILSRPLGSIVAVGRTEVTEVVEIVGRDGEDEQKSKSVREFAAGLEAYRQGRLKEALEIFEGCLRIWAEDGPAKVYADLSRKGLQEPGTGEWDPIVRMTSK
ncbi:MAG: CHASE2 domain-containing protein, partial [Phycisphaerae bacterium]|nr:CHASE2 domain-containing protein [Phycisphaerae bacterium]